MICYTLVYFLQKPTSISYIEVCQNQPSKAMLLLYLALSLQTSSALLLSTENRISTRNITCKHGSPSTSTMLLLNCEACLITSRNYLIETTLSLTGPGPIGISYACLQVNDVEVYHANLVRECRSFPRDTLNGYDDFCVASPYNFVRGSYRACICTSNACNLDFSRCTQPINPNREPPIPLFNTTIRELTNRVKCYRPYDDYNQEIFSNLTRFCSNDDEECQDYIFEKGVLCVISVDRTNQITRQTLIPSVYPAYLIKYKTQICNAYAMTSKSISFAQCQLDDTVCMCALNECNKDLETCRTSGGINTTVSTIYFLLVLIFNACILK